jgi:carboxypeptidase C (cathepsin A)
MKRVIRKGLISTTALGIAFALLLMGGLCRAQESAPVATRGFLEDEPGVTHHQATVHGKTLSYTARAGFLSIRDEEQVVHARMFYTSYTADQPASAPLHPLIFVWNGGPGSNASLLELGALGPRRIDKRPGTSSANSRSPLVDNEDTWLQFADLIFVDPIDTGYSYATSPDTLKEFLNDQGDADSIAEFIRLYRSHYGLQQAPLYIMGESYGTYRAAGVAEILAQRKIPLEGVILLSSVLNFGPSEGDLSPVFLLPNYAATAFVQQRLAPELQGNLEKTVNEVQNWAESDYLAALIQGDRLPEDRKKAIAQRLARYTGVDSDTWVHADLKLEPDQFAVDVLGADKLEYVGHYDTTVIGKLSHKGEPYNVDADPSLANGVDAVIYGYLRDDLGFKTDAFYKGPFGGGWPSPTSFRGDWTSVRWNRATQSRDRAASLASALHSTPGLRVLVTAGYYDFSTPFAATEYTISHLNLDPGARKRIKFIRYEGGHAAYMDPKVRAQFASDAQAFVLFRGEGH